MQHFSGIQRKMIDAIEYLSEALIFFDAGGKIQYANARGRELLKLNGNPVILSAIIGYRAEEIRPRDARWGHGPIQVKSTLKDPGTGQQIYLSLFRTLEGYVAVSEGVDGVATRRLDEEINKCNEQLRLTYDVQTQITRSINLDETLDAVVKNVPQMIGLENCIIFIIEDNEIVEVKTTERLKKKFGKFRVSMDELIATRKALETGQAIVIEDISQYSEISKRMVDMVGARTGIILPLAARGKMIGAIWLYNTGEPKTYSKDDVARAKALSNQVASAVDNAMLFNELSRAKGELEASYERLKSLDRMKMEFFTVISHELRTPLTTIKGYAELIRDGMLGPVNDQQRDRLSRIDSSVDRLTSIVESLSDLSGVASKQYAGEKIPVSLNELIDEVVRGIVFVAEAKQIPITVDIPLKLPMVNVDRNRIQQVFLNILNNAIKYTSAGGKISIVARDKGDHLLVSIHDTGIGIPGEDLENIFSGFYHAGYKLSYEYKGVGLGLAISRQIIQNHGGKIWAESEPGKGSTFYFTLPKQAPGV